MKLAPLLVLLVVVASVACGQVIQEEKFGSWTLTKAVDEFTDEITFLSIQSGGVGIYSLNGTPYVELRDVYSEERLEALKQQYITHQIDLSNPLSSPYRYSCNKVIERSTEVVVQYRVDNRGMVSSDSWGPYLDQSRYGASSVNRFRFPDLNIRCPSSEYTKTVAACKEGNTIAFRWKLEGDEKWSVTISADLKGFTQAYASFEKYLKKQTG